MSLIILCARVASSLTQSLTPRIDDSFSMCKCCLLLSPVLVLLQGILEAEAFNVALDRAIDVQGPRAYSSRLPPSLFGYALALGKTDLYVGAPGYEDAGAVFTCYFGGLRRGQNRVNCVQIRGERRMTPALYCYM